LLDEKYFTKTLRQFGKYPSVIKSLITFRNVLLKKAYNETGSALTQAIDAMPSRSRAELNNFRGSQRKLYSGMRARVGDSTHPTEITARVHQYAADAWSRASAQERMAIIRHPFARYALFDKVMRNPHTIEERLAVCGHKNLTNTTATNIFDKYRALDEAVALIKNPVVQDGLIAKLMARYPGQLNAFALEHPKRGIETFTEAVEQCASLQDARFLLSHDLLNKLDPHEEKVRSGLSSLFIRFPDTHFRADILERVFTGNRDEALAKAHAKLLEMKEALIQKNAMLSAKGNLLELNMRKHAVRSSAFVLTELKLRMNRAEFMANECKINEYTSDLIDNRAKLAARNTEKLLSFIKAHPAYFTNDLNFETLRRIQTRFPDQTFMRSLESAIHSEFKPEPIFYAPRISPAPAYQVPPMHVGHDPRLMYYPVHPEQQYAAYGAWIGNLGMRMDTPMPDAYYG
jgi:hypothetical protein